MSIQRTVFRRGISVAAAVLGLGAVVAPIATASDAILPGPYDPYPYEPPTITFAAGDSSITATITNPNDKGYCYATIGMPGDGDGGPNDHSGTVEIFGGEHDADWPGPGETTTLTQTGLPEYVYRIHADCAATEHSISRSDRVEYEVAVGQDNSAPDGSATGLFGSLGSLSGRLS